MWRPVFQGWAVDSWAGGVRSMAVAIAIFVGLGGIAVAHERVVITAAHTTSADYPYQIGLLAMAKALREKTAGGLDLKIHPNGALGGDERKVLESVRQQSIGLTVVNGAAISNLSKKADVFNLPFIFRDLNHLFAAMDGEPGRIVAQDLADKGLKVIAWYANPERHLFTSEKPVRRLEDLRGLKIRVTQSPVSIETFRALGAVPTPMPYGELFGALKSSIVDGGENDWFGIRGLRFYEVARNISLTGHFMVACPVIVSRTWYDSLPDSTRKALDEAAVIGQKSMRDYMIRETAKIRREVEAKGGKVVVVEDIERWREATRPVYPLFYETIGKDLIERVINAR